MTGVDLRTLGGTEQAAAGLGSTSAAAVALQNVACQQVNVAVTSPTPQAPTGNVAVVRVGDGSAPLASAATPVFVDEYTLAGTKVQSLAYGQ